MNGKLKVAFSCYAIAALLLLVFALVYLTRSEFMPYHSDAVGLEWAEVDPAFQTLVLGLMRVCGGGWLATVLAMFFLLLKPFREGARWSCWALPVIGLAATLPALYATLYIAHYTSANPPWIAAVIGILLLIAGRIFSLRPCSLKK